MHRAAQPTGSSAHHRSKSLARGLERPLTFIVTPLQDLKKKQPKPIAKVVSREASTDEESVGAAAAAAVITKKKSLKKAKLPATTSSQLRKKQTKKQASLAARAAGASAAAAASAQGPSTPTSVRKPQKKAVQFSYPVCIHTEAQGSFGGGVCRICEAEAHQRQATHKNHPKYKETVFQVDDGQNAIANQTIASWLETIKRQLTMPVTSAQEFQKGLEILAHATTTIRTLEIPRAIKKSQFIAQCKRSLARLEHQYRLAGPSALRPYDTQLALQKLAKFLAELEPLPKLQSIEQCTAIIAAINSTINEITSTLATPLSAQDISTYRRYYTLLEQKQHEYQQALEQSNAKVIHLLKETNKKINTAKASQVDVDEIGIMKLTIRVLAAELNTISELAESALTKHGFSVYLEEYLRLTRTTLNSLEHRLAELRATAASELELAVMQQQLAIMPPIMRLAKMQQDFSAYQQEAARAGIATLSPYIKYLQANMPALERSIQSAEAVFATHPAHLINTDFIGRAAQYLRTRRKSLDALSRPRSP